jgi:hypothetical protein
LVLIHQQGAAAASAFSINPQITRPQATATTFVMLRARVAGWAGYVQ